MQFVPWRYIADWKCNACGDCCRLYSVVLNFYEWLKIVKSYGVEQTVPGLDRLYVKRRGDGSCAFLCHFSDIHSCGLQYMKPRACQLWPFKVLTHPKYGCAKEAAYHYGEQLFFVYADSMCAGIRCGSPAWKFANQTLKEFIEIAMGVCSGQFRTTADMDFLTLQTGLRRRYPRSHV